MRTFITRVGHKTNKRVYGTLFKEKESLILQLSKHKSINKKEPSPKFISEEHFSSKIVDDTIWDSFTELTEAEHSERWAEDLISV